jgi:tetratricopeptide (TPR) repeat protein
MKRILTFFTVLLLVPLAALHSADGFLVKDGQPRAEIVIAETPPRTVRLAAQELQEGIEKISGAHLPIVTTPSGNAAKIFVGRSGHTDRLKVTADGLKDGAYRIATGEDWMVLLGEDTEFTPIEPWAKGNSQIVEGSAQREWNKMTGSAWGLPNVLIYKDRTVIPGDTGLPDAARSATKLKPIEIWAQDERGSFNAVCGFLMKLGVRWYLPGELGEVMPSLKTIALPKLNETVRPDFSIRRFNVRFATHGEKFVRWAMRLGLRDPYGIEAAHGMDTMTDHEEVFAAHPDWYALYGGKRRYQRGANNHLCYSNEELFQETVRYVRALFDHYKMDMISVMPPDGYVAICQCPLCAGKDSPERDNRGLASDYIWGFVNRVAKEVRKTHPDKKVMNCAYGIYSLPPLKIEKLEPNVVVSIVGGRRPMNNRPEEQEEFRKLREGWVAKTSNPIIIFENYPFTDRGWYLPSFTPHSLGAGISATKGISQGEDIWLSIRQEVEKQDLGFNHFPIYFTQRMYWGGKDADVDAMFREYVRLFYGPAEVEMNAFFDYCEANWQAMEKEKEKADTALALFDKAKVKAGTSGVHGRRLALIDDFLKGLRNKSAQLGKVRGPLPVLRLVGPPREKIVVDGKLDDDAWVNAFPSATVRLRELQTGRQPIFGTTVKAAWHGNDLYFAIRCDEHPGEKPNIGATRKDDSAIWYGDAVEVLIETEAHSYYQIAVSPSGAVCDLDRGVEHAKWFTWDAKAEVATRVEDDHWIIEMKLPIRQDENDPLNQIVGHHPTRSLPWHFNVCRQRVREDGSEYSAFSPTGSDGFHDVMKFATFFDGNSFEFDHGPADDDFLEALRVAADLARTGKREEALAAYITAADRKCSDLQKSHTLELAATSASGQRKPELAEQLTARIPIEAVKKAVRMQTLLEQTKTPLVIAEFGKEDIGKWPFWKRGDGYAARGRAYVITKSGKEAEADLTRALEWLSDPRQRDDVSLNLAQNREANLKDEDGALTGYHAVIDNAKYLGSSTQFYSVHGIANILSKRGKFDEALATLKLVNHEKAGGFWHDQFRLWIAGTLHAAGRKDEALAAYREIIADKSSDPRLRKVAEESLASLSK